MFRKPPLLIVLGWACLIAIAPAADASEASEDEQMRAHIRLLEQMLRDAGVDPPPRPGDHAPHHAPGHDPEPEPAVEPIVPDDLDVSKGLASAIRVINERGDDAPAALRRVRAWMNRKGAEDQRDAGDVILAVFAWTERTLEAVEAMHETDPVAGYMMAQEAVRILGNDPMAVPFNQHINTIKSDRETWRNIESTAAFRKAIQQADALGLTGDWALLDLHNDALAQQYRKVRSKLKLIHHTWPETDAAKQAQTHLERWDALLAQAEDDLPAWRYTWNFALIHLGTKKTTIIKTDPKGYVTIIDKERALYDPRRVVLFGTFQNTSDKPYRYTFVAGVSRRTYKGPLRPDDLDQLAGYSLIETHVLQPGEVYRWETEVAVNDSGEIRQAGITQVEAIEPRRVAR